MADLANSTSTTRRTFLKGTTAAGALGALAIPRAVHADGDGGDALKLGLVGCGSRGEGAVSLEPSADGRE